MDSEIRIGVLTVAFNEERFIVPCIKQFEFWGFNHLVLVSSKPWHGEYEADNTASIARENTYANVISGVWENQAEQFNAGLETFTNFDWVLIVDADEFYTRDDVKHLIVDMVNTDADVIRAPDMEVYWKTPDFRILPRQTDNPVVAVRPHVRFTEKRSVDSINSTETDATLHHLSYVRTDEDMLKKIHSFEHSNEFDLDKWYNEKWLDWNNTAEKNFDLHPVVPEQFKKALFNPAPAEIFYATVL